MYLAYDLHCQICKTWFTSQTDATQHYAGKKHIRAANGGPRARYEFAFTNSLTILLWIYWWLLSFNTLTATPNYASQCLILLSRRRYFVIITFINSFFYHGFWMKYLWIMRACLDIHYGKMIILNNGWLNVVIVKWKFCQICQLVKMM